MAIKQKKGIVVSDAMDKTVVVEIVRFKNHPLYHKKYKITSKLKAHDENNKFKVGDEVTIVESRPISKTKNWKVLDSK